MIEMGSQRVSETITKAAKREVIVWLVHTKTRTKRNARKVVSLRQHTISWWGVGDVGGGKAKRGGKRTEDRGCKEIPCER